MLIQIDMREKELIDLVKTINGIHTNTYNIDIAALPIGDIILMDKDGNEVIIIERKTLYDLASSIKDGRYKEQSFRLSNTNVPNHNIIYLIEGDWNTYNETKGRMDKNTLLSACTTLNHYKGFSVWKTSSMNDSAHWIIQLCNKIDKMGTSESSYYKLGDQISESTKSYIDVTKREKKKNIDESNISIFMLTCIPGVSTKIAQCVVDKFGSIKQIIAAISENKNVLDNLSMTSTSSGKERKISKSVIQQIVQYLDQ